MKHYARDAEVSEDEEDCLTEPSQRFQRPQVPDRAPASRCTGADLAKKNGPNVCEWPPIGDIYGINDINSGLFDSQAPTGSSDENHGMDDRPCKRNFFG